MSGRLTAATVVALVHLHAAAAQQACLGEACARPEKPLPILLRTCTTARGCVDDPDTQHYLTMDAEWRSLQETKSPTSCWRNGTWVSPECRTPADQQKCAEACMLDGVDYTAHGVSTGPDGRSVTLRFEGSSGNVGSRLFLLEKTAAGGGEKQGTKKAAAAAAAYRYAQFKMLNREVSVTVDASQLTCGISAPLYFAQMDPSGGYDGGANTAGALYGTGYCDAACPDNLRFVAGRGNIPARSWKSCCTVFGLWEANQVTTAFAGRPCKADGPVACDGSAEECDALCDADGCDVASFRLQYFSSGFDPRKVDFWGEGLRVDASKNVTVVTQFLTTDGTDHGALSEVRRLYVQAGKVVANFNYTVGGKTYDSMTEASCAAAAGAFGSGNSFAAHGGLAGLGRALSKGVSLVMGIRDDRAAKLLWLDGLFPPNASSTDAGAYRGTCTADDGPPVVPEKNYAKVTATYSDVRVGEIGSTYRE